jgi:hypothetical protein
LFSITYNVAGVARVLGVLGNDDRVLHEVLGDDAVQHEEDTEWEDEEDGNGENEEESRPESVRLGEADWNFGAIIILLVAERGHSEDWAGKRKKMILK